MKKERRSISLLVLLISVFMTGNMFAQGQNANIGDIKQNPNSYRNESVTIIGTIEKYEPSTGNTTAYYVIKGDYGNAIRVNTDSERPKTNKRYKVQGTVYINVDNGNPFISEKSKSLIPDSEPMPDPEPDPKPEPEKKQEVEEESGISTNTIIIIAIIIVLIIIVVLLVTQQRGNKTNKSQQNQQQPQTPPSQPKSAPQASSPTASTVKYETFKGQNTVKVPAPQSGGETRKAIPGELVITKGSEVDKSFKLFGTPTSSGAVCSIGNETQGWESKVPSGRKESHILVQDPTKTLSRYQAEIIFDGQKTYLKNYSSVNKTVVNSKELMENESIELKGGETIQAGRVEFKYKL